MRIDRCGDLPSKVAPAENFTGTVRVDGPFVGSGDLSGATVTFEPGARTAWHRHPLGQTLLVTAGTGHVQRETGPLETIRAGDIVWIEPGEWHWHGATATTGMSHVAIAEKKEGVSAEWRGKVTDEEIAASPTG